MRKRRRQRRGNRNRRRRKRCRKRRIRRLREDSEKIYMLTQWSMTSALFFIFFYIALSLNSFSFSEDFPVFGLLSLLIYKK